MQDPDSRNKNFFSKIRIYSIDYQPYSYSFLCYGINEITLLYQTYMLAKNEYKNSSIASCYPSNSEIVLKTNQIFNSPCANGLLFNHTFNFTANTSLIENVKLYFYLFFFIN